MLKELRKEVENHCMQKNGFKHVFRKDVTRGFCANKGCVEVAKENCSVCGLGYCTQKCQRIDWKFRHKQFCKKEDIRKTKILFNIFDKRLEDYRSGKTSVERYFSIAHVDVVLRDFKAFEDKILDEEACIKSIRRIPCYRILDAEPESGRILSVLEED